MKSVPGSLDVQHFWQAAIHIPVIDVRSPSEFANGHFPNAHNLPLLDDNERAIIGTLYKQQGVQSAIYRGLELVGPKMVTLLQNGELLANSSGQLLVYCWRGGQRSGSMAWLLRLGKLKVHTLIGGYKAFRQEVLRTFMQPYQFRVLGGVTGSGKTRILQAMQELLHAHAEKYSPQQVIDLEALAHHRGSAFGGLGQLPQPTQQQFENQLAHALYPFTTNTPIWLESESHTIGKMIIPSNIIQLMRYSPRIDIQLPKNERIAQLIADYGQFPPSELEAAILKIARKIGDANCKKALQALHSGDLEQVVISVLDYYDKCYQMSVEKQAPGSYYATFDITGMAITEVAHRLLTWKY
jgi:tRNA 2-selenouridine synthase